MRFVSALDPRAEAKLQASTIPYGSGDAWCYGVGNGELVRACLARAKRVHVVKVCEEWDRQTDLMRGDLAAAFFLGRLTISRATSDTLLYAPFAHSPMEVFRADPDAWGLRDRIHVVVNEQVARLHLRRVATQRWPVTALPDPPVGELLCDRLTAAVVCMGGPTLASQYDRIRQLGLPVISASTSLLPLQRAGIRVDYTVCVDGIFEQFAGAVTTDALAYAPTVDPRIPAAWAGPRYVIGNELFSGGSVVHAAVDLAVKMGARVVYLAGADFAYPGGASHVAGNVEPIGLAARGRLMTMSGLGVPVRTDQNLCQYRVFLEKYVELNPGVWFVKMGREGSAVKGMEWDA